MMKAKKKKNKQPVIKRELREMTFEQAVDEVLDLKDKVGTIPTKHDYEKLKVDTESLVEALGVRNSMESLGTQAYAAINIAVLRELRRRRGEIVKIAEIETADWPKRIIFED